MSQENARITVVATTKLGKQPLQQQSRAEQRRSGAEVERKNDRAGRGGAEDSEE